MQGLLNDETPVTAGCDEGLSGRGNNHLRYRGHRGRRLMYAEHRLPAISPRGIPELRMLDLDAECRVAAGCNDSDTNLVVQRIIDDRTEDDVRLRVSDRVYDLCCGVYFEQ